MNARNALTALVLGLTPLTGACQARSDAGGDGNTAATASVSPGVEILEPANGATVTGPVRVVLRANGVEIVPATDERPGTGHHHLFVDRDVTPVTDTMPRGVTGILHLGSGQTEFVLDSLRPGPHRVIAVVGDFRHTSIPGVAFDTVEFIVQ